mmetsp:Transcript_39105/g.124322  ORF Transcript_39105/g.124322 Transcript_39105/m.124322 type:complete len:236 (+) Transcript_39105:231-938(+)
MGAGQARTAWSWARACARAGLRRPPSASRTASPQADWCSGCHRSPSSALRSCSPSPPARPGSSGLRRGVASAHRRASRPSQTRRARAPRRTATVAAPRTPAMCPRPQAATAADLRQVAPARPQAGWHPKPATYPCCGSKARCRRDCSACQSCHRKAPGGISLVPASLVPLSSREAARTASRATSATCAPLGRRRCASRCGRLSSVAPACGRSSSKFAAREQQLWPELGPRAGPTL